MQDKLKFPECSDDKIRIVDFSEGHLTERYVSWLNDPEVVRYSEQRHHQHTLTTCLNYFNSQRNSPNFFLAIELKDDDNLHIGNMGVEIDNYNNKADVSILIGEKNIWGTGVATRAWGLALNALTLELGYRLVTAGTMETNIPMINLMIRCGMTIDAILPKRFILDSKQIGLVSASYYPVNVIETI